MRPDNLVSTGRAGLFRSLRKSPPNACCVHLDIRESDIPIADILVGVVPNLFVANDPVNQAYLPVGNLNMRPKVLVIFFDDRDARIGHRIGEIVRYDLTDEGLVIFIVEFLNLILVTIVLVNRLFVQHRMRRAPVHLRDISTGLHIDDDIIVPANTSQRYLVRGIRVISPVIGRTTVVVALHFMNHLMLG